MTDDEKNKRGPHRKPPAGGGKGRPQAGRRDARAQPGKPRSDKPRFDKPRPGKVQAGRPQSARSEAGRPPSGMARPGERIAKRLARAGVSSRRDAEEMIAAGRVTLNGRVLDTPAVNVGDKDRIEIDGKPIPAIERTRLFLFHKPAGVVTTNRDPEGRKTVFDVLPSDLPRLMTVGRLDINTEGLLLLTNDGGLARLLELPATGWLRRYRVRVHGKVDQQALAGLKDGIAVDGVFYGAIEAALEREQGANAWLSIGLREGKNREVKNVMAALGLDVTRLIRVSYGPFQLGDLGEGQVRELCGRHLRDQLGERLIAEAGANFDAPLATPAAGGKSDERGARKDAHKDERGARKETGKPGARRSGPKPREDALDRLQTKPGPRKKPEKGRDAERREAPPPRSRSSNVWMAPGARAMGPKKAAEHEEATKDRRYAGKPRPQGPGRPAPEGARQRTDEPRRPQGPDKPRPRPGPGSGKSKGKR